MYVHFEGYLTIGKRMPQLVVLRKIHLTIVCILPLSTLHNLTQTHAINLFGGHFRKILYYVVA